MAVNPKKDRDEAPEEPEAFQSLLKPVDEPIFGGEAKTLVVDRDVNLHQLVEEVYERLGNREKYQVVAHLEDDEIPVSPENPLTLYVHGGADMRTVRGAVESHDKDPNYGLTDADRRLQGLREKLQSGQDLPAAELNEVLRSLL